MKITVIVPAYNEEKYIGDCLQSLLNNPPENLEEIIVVNNASTDNTAAIAARFSRVRVVEEPIKGLTHARQRGMKEAKSELLAYVDADTRINRHWYDVLNRAFSSNPKLVCLSGPYNYYDLGGLNRAWINFYWRLVILTYWMNRCVVIGGNFAARKSALEKMGGFDTSIAFYGEDTNIARRIRSVGKIRFSREFTLLTSGRRFVKDGMIRTGVRYGLNYIWEMMFRRPLTKDYIDIR
ncbi:MAG: glycosyltransferase family A protein [bacterium]|nr:glycosyltransferase family A protein [bacterium]